MIKRRIDTIKNVPDFLIKHYTKRLKKKPQSLLFLPLANTYRLNGQLEEAIEICEAGIESHPEYISGRVLFGQVYLESEMLEEAELEFKKALKLNNSNLKARNMLYKIYSEKGDDISAFSQLEKIIKINHIDKNINKEYQSLKERLSEEDKEKAPGEVYIDSSGIYEKTEERKRAIVKRVRDFSQIRTRQAKRITNVNQSSPNHNTEKTIKVLESWLVNIKKLN